MKKHRTKYFNRNGSKYIFSKYDPYSIMDNGIQVDRTYQDLEQLRKHTNIAEIFRKYERNTLRFLFQDFWKLECDVRIERRDLNNHNEEYIKNLNKRLEKLIERCLKKKIKSSSNRINMITVVDALFGIGKDDEVMELYSHKSLIEQFALEDSIFIVGRKTYESKWFKSLDLQNNEVRVLSKTLKNTYTNNHKIYKYPNLMLSRTKNDYREIYILGGESIFSTFYHKVTDLYVGFIDTYIKEFNKHFTEIDLRSWVMPECAVITAEENKDTINYTIAHLQKVKNHDVIWKPNKMKKWV